AARPGAGGPTTGGLPPAGNGCHTGPRTGREAAMREDHPRALVTGASRGIGTAIARALGPTHDLLLGGRDVAALEELAATLPSARPWAVELTDRDAVARATERVDRLDVLVHSAGIWVPGS